MNETPSKTDIVSDDEAELMLEAIKQASAMRNRITTTEFSKYEVLYSKEETTPPESGDPSAMLKWHNRYKELMQLSHELHMRVDPYSPISITHPISGEVIKTLPAIYCRVPLLNETRHGSSMAVAASALMTAIERDGSGFTDDVTPLANMITEELKNARTPEQLEYLKSLAEHERTSASSTPVSKTSIGDTMDQVQWED